MISFEKFVPIDGSPIYLQIITYLKRGIAAGFILDGDEMPSRRVASALLGINPNTVQKSYRLLEEEGIVSSNQGAKSYVTINGDKIASIRSELLSAEANAATIAMKQMGVSKEEALMAISRAWDEPEKGKSNL
ncbi:MAG: GntR family transcriptional regulator [Clostridiaceae bacterium]|nr:GntR family transcriptional regulator [Clostridiaceae bacterium]